MWLFNSSIGRKVMMSLTGIALILFLTFHMSMNAVALFSADGYNMICEMLGANWYAVVATIALAGLAVLHIFYAFVLTAKNRAARGGDNYAVSEKPSKVEWASQNMLVLGLIVLLGLGLHLYDFWAKMMLVDLGCDALGTEVHSTDGAYWIQTIFADPIHVAIYTVWLIAIWFHLTHGFWSALQTLGMNGKTWFCRLKVISIAYATVICFGFLSVVLCFFGRSLCC